jgi:hypothetical protein
LPWAITAEVETARMARPTRIFFMLCSLEKKKKKTQQQSTTNPE